MTTKLDIAHLIHAYAVYYSDLNHHNNRCSELILKADFLNDKEYRGERALRLNALRHLNRIGNELRELGYNVSIDTGYDHLLEES